MINIGIKITDKEGNIIQDAVVEIHHSPFCQLPFEAKSRTNEYGVCHIYVPEDKHDMENLKVFKGEINHV